MIGISFFMIPINSHLQEIIMIRKVLILLLSALLCVCCVACSQKPPENTSSEQNTPSEYQPPYKTPETPEEHQEFLRFLCANTANMSPFTLTLTNDTFVHYESHTVEFDGVTLTHTVRRFTQVDIGEYVSDSHQVWTLNTKTQTVTPSINDGITVPTQITIPNILNSFFVDDLLQTIADNSTHCSTIDKDTYTIPNLTINTIDGTKYMENIRIMHENGVIKSIESTFGQQQLNLVINRHIDVLEK